MPDPVPTPKPAARKQPSGTLGGLMRAESVTRIALALPISVLVGWGLGAALDHWLHQDWIYIVGVVLGAVAGFIEVFHIMAQASRELP